MVGVSLLEFARSGTFGPVGLGLDRRRTVRLLGAPDEWGAPFKSFKKAAIWKYGTTEFHFSRDVIWLIHSDDFDVPDGGSRLDLEPWVLHRGMALSALERAMTAAAIPRRIEPCRYEPGAVVLTTAPGVRFVFTETDHSPALGLSAFSHSAHEGAN